MNNQMEAFEQNYRAFISSKTLRLRFVFANMRVNGTNGIFLFQP